MPRASALLLVIAAAMLALQSAYASFINPVKNEPGDSYDDSNMDDYYDDLNEYHFGGELQNIGKRSSLIYVFRRACIRRGGNCDHRPGDCCHSSSCRCNLWGSNCRCQRMGLFQKWG